MQGESVSAESAPADSMSVHGRAASSAATANDEKLAAADTSKSDGDGGDPVEKKKQLPLNKGKWTPEEFEYMLGLMEAFKAGHLPLQEGTTLRSFLSRMMKCKPKRISKKFEGISYNGRLTYKKTKDPLSLAAGMLLRARLNELERRYLLSAEDRDDEGGQTPHHTSIDELLQQAMPAETSRLPANSSTPLALPSSLTAQEPEGSSVASGGALRNGPSAVLPSWAGLGGMRALDSSSGFGPLGDQVGGQLRGQLGGPTLRAGGFSSTNSDSSVNAQANLLKEMEIEQQRQNLLNRGGESGGLAAALLQRNQPDSTTSLLLSGNEAFRNNMESYVSYRETMQKISSNFQSPLQRTLNLETQQQRHNQLRSHSLSSGANPSTALAVLRQHREHNRATFIHNNINNLESISQAALCNRPLQNLGGLSSNIHNTDTVMPVSPQRNLSLNRFALPALQEDASIYRQRSAAVPGISSSLMESLMGMGGGSSSNIGNGPSSLDHPTTSSSRRLGNHSGPSLIMGNAGQALHTDVGSIDAGNNTPATSLSQILKRQREENDALEQWKRHRR